ncbi:MAG TPA: GNAT family protein [Opitutaceae bacterium]|nr:GNAT family protein [Opitutaceae bacterium]
MNPFDPKPVTLEFDVGRALRPTVRLVPMGAVHAKALVDASRSPEVWEHMTIPLPADEAAMAAWVSEALTAQEAGTQVPFVIEVDGKVAGSTRYLEIRRGDLRIEIGWTWLAPEFWRTAVNTTCKFLLLRHAFEVLGAARVELKTDVRNTRSQAAIERIGAKREGVLRGYQRLWTGRQRDTAMFSIIASEWPAVKAELERRLGR